MREMPVTLTPRVTQGMLVTNGVVYQGYYKNEYTYKSGLLGGNGVPLPRAIRYT